MKGKLIKVSEGIIFVIDERPKIGDWYYDEMDSIIINCKYDGWGIVDRRCHKILSSTFGVGLELVLTAQSNLGNMNMAFDDIVLSMLDFNTDHPYKIENNKVIIQL